jgi:hypothetical protein
MLKVFKAMVPSVARSLLSRIYRFKDAYKGESCYLIGDGISVKWFDLAKLTDKLAIPSGLLPFHKDFHLLNIEQCLLSEPWWFYPIQRTTSPPIRIIRNHIQQAYRDIIRLNPDKQFLVNLSNYPVLSDSNITYTFNDIYDNRLPPNFISKRINAFYGSARTSILMAIYLGFDHTYLVGFDYTHSPSRILHWYEKGQGIVKDDSDYQKEFFKIAKEFIDITTITLDNKSKHLDYITYKDFTGEDPVYHENTEILSPEKLKVLSSWPGYTIY